MSNVVQTYTYKGVEIKLHVSETSVRFVAEPTGKRLTAPSLSAIKKQIDELKIADFKPFAGLFEETGYDVNKLIKAGHKPVATVHDEYCGGRALFSVEIVGWLKSDSKFHDASGRSFNVVWKEGLGAVEAYVHYQEARLRVEERIIQLKAEASEAYAAWSKFAAPTEGLK